MVQRYSSFITNIDRRITISAAALLGVLNFIATSAHAYRVGFPLDDTWIHLTYARNLALHGEWAFRLGDASAGSTSPLWTALLSLGYLLHLSPYVWVFFLGWVILSFTAIRADSFARGLSNTYQSKIPWVGLFVALAWQLTWSATSGMETLLHGAILLVVLGMLAQGSRQYLILGLLAGLSVWVRPDGLTLLGPILLTSFLQEATYWNRGEAWLKVFIGFGTLFLFYLLFNLALSDTPMPNTFYAKQAEYGPSWSVLPFSIRFQEYLLPILASPLVVFLPGLFYWVYKIFHDRNWGAIAGFLWFMGYLGIYVSRLPAYQHGRYILPSFPYIYLVGMVGSLMAMNTPKMNMHLRLLWQVTTVGLVIVFQGIGARQNAQDVIFVETQMIETARWINENLASDAFLAVHDIGAVGYFTENPILDLAGLVTPEVVPFIRDEIRLADYLDQSQVNYLVTFPGWYPELVNGRVPLFRADNPIYRFEDRMTVFNWP